MAVDPDYRCAAMLIYGTKLVVLPYQRDEMAVDKKISPRLYTCTNPCAMLHTHAHMHKCWIQYTHVNIHDNLKDVILGLIVSYVCTYCM